MSVNILLGWTIVGWIVALVMAIKNPKTECCKSET